MSKKCLSCDKPHPKEEEGATFTRYRKFWFNRVVWLCGECCKYGHNHRAAIRELVK